MIAPSFAEIFHSNAMNNRLLLVALPQDQAATLMKDAEDPAGLPVRIDVDSTTLTGGKLTARFDLSPRHQRMFLEGLDVIGLTLTHGDRIRAFSETHWVQQPWLRDVAARTVSRLRSSQRPCGLPAAVPATDGHGRDAPIEPDVESSATR